MHKRKGKILYEGSLDEKLQKNSERNVCHQQRSLSHRFCGGIGLNCASNRYPFVDEQRDRCP